MSIRGELFTTQVTLDNRSYFFNVKENRNGDVFLQVVESKSKNGEEADRHAIVIFADDMQKFFKGMDKSLKFIEKDKKTRAKTAETKKRVYRKKADDQTQKPLVRENDGIKRTGKVHVVSKRKPTTDSTKTE